jgi:hypothetical protein
MFAYLLILFAIVTRVAPHAAWFNFTAVGGSLLFFGARRPLREAILPLALLASTDYYLTAYIYAYPFHVASYLVTWGWYAAIMILGARLLNGNPRAGRIAGAAVLSSTSFFALSNFAVWAGLGMYPHSISGLAACFAAGVPFYRNDLISTMLVAGLAFGAPQLASHLARMHQTSHSA